MNQATRIPLHARDGSVRAYVLVDAEDYERISRYRWCLSVKGYAVRNVRGRRDGKQHTVWMHRLVMRRPRGDALQVDHINRDKLDNRKANLRLVTDAQQRQNRDSYKGSSSRYRGVARTGRPDWPWQAAVRVNGKRITCGWFRNEEEAAEAARQARQKLMSHAEN